MDSPAHSPVELARTAVAWIDRSDWSMLVARGADRVDLLNRLSTNDLTALRPGGGIQTVLLTDKARIIDILTLLHDTDTTRIIASPEQAPAIVRWLRKYTIMDDVRLTDESAAWEFVEITGPRAGDAVNGMLGIDVTPLAVAGWTTMSFDDAQLLVVRMPAMCELSYWVGGPAAAMQAIRERLQAASDLIPALDVADVEYLRVISGMGSIGHEWSDAYNPLEAGLLHLTSFTKGCYIGQEVVARLDSYNKVKQRVMGFVTDAPVGVGDTIVSDGKDVGRITTMAPRRNANGMVALGYIRGEHAHAESTVLVNHEGAEIAARILALPM